MVGARRREGSSKGLPPWRTTTDWASLAVMHGLTKALITQILQQEGQGFAQLQSVAGGIGEEESALSNSESSLDSSAASRAFSFLS